MKLFRGLFEFVKNKSPFYQEGLPISAASESVVAARRDLLIQSFHLPAGLRNAPYSVCRQ